MTLLPKSLLGRNVLLIIGIIALGQLITMIVFALSMQRPRADAMATLVVAQVNSVRSALALLPPELRDEYIERLNRNGNVSAAMNLPANTHIQVESFALNPTDDAHSLNPQIRYFVDALEKQLNSAEDVIWLSDADDSILIRVDNTHWLHFAGRFIRPQFSTWWLLASLAYAALAFIGAYQIQRRLNRPLQELATAAQEMGRGHFPAALPEDTLQEIAIVSRNFNAMVRNLANLDSERALMLAGISHDLRTPLTKLRISLEILDPGEENALALAMIRHIEEMDATIGQFIDFARLNSDETLTTVDVNALITTLADQFAIQRSPFVLQLETLPLMRLRPIAMQRLLSNLMHNAARYARTGLEIETKFFHEAIHVHVLDRGPGVPDNQLERLRQPFARLHGARNGLTGAGLGLAIAEKVAQLHGGNLQLALREGGGLAVIVQLPITTVA